MKKLIAMLGAVVAAVTSAWAATVTFVEGSTTDFTVINSTGNAGKYNWNGYNNAFGIKIPAAEGLAEGTKVYLKSLTFVMGNGDLSSANVPDSITIGGYTVNKDATQKNDGLGGNTDRNKVIYAFAEGSRPVLTVGTEAHVTTTGLANLRALPTSSNADKEDPLIVILNNKQYQPVAKVEASIAPDFTTAEITTDTEGVDTITWSNGEPTAEKPGVLTIDENVTLTVTDLTALNYVTLAGAGTLKVTGSMTINRAYTSPVTFGAEWTGTLHLVGTTMAYCDFNKFVGVGKVKVTDVAGYLEDDKMFPGEIILEDDGETVALNVNNGDSGRYYKVAKLSGNGTLKVTGAGTATQQTVVADSSDFTGTIIVADANNKKSVLFGNAAEFSANAQGSIVVATAATIPEGKTWTARNAIIINSAGTLTMNGTTESTIKGAGKLTGYTAFSQVTNAIKTSLQAETWTGSLVVTGATIQNGAVTDSKTTLNQFGNANSKIEFAGNCNGYFGLSRLNAGDTEVAILPELVISGTLALNDGFTQRDNSVYYYTLINKLSGSGALSCSKNTINPLLIVKDGASYAGSITATNLKVVFGEPAEPMTFVENNTLTIDEGKTATIASGKSFKAANGITVDGTLTVAAGAAQKGLENNLTIGKTGSVTVNQSDWIKYDVGSAQTIKVAGTLDCGAKRQSFGANNKLVVVAGATITGVGDGEGAIDNFGGSKITIEADPTETDPATEVTWSATTRYRGQPELEVAEGVTLNMTGNVIVEGTNAKTVTKTGAGVLKLMGSVAETVTHKLTAGTIVSNVAGLTVTVEEGATLYTQTDEGVTTYALTPFDPGEELPGEALIDEAEKADYEAWADANGVTAETKTDPSVLAIAFHLGATISEGVTIEKAAQAEVEELVADIDLAALVAEGEEAALEALNDALKAKGLVASLKPVTLTGASETTNLYKLVIKLIKENTTEE